MTDENESACHQHDDCPLSATRRRFIRDTVLTVAGTVVALGATRSTAMAMPLEFTKAKSRAGSKRSYGIPATDGAQIDHDNQVILVRWANAVYAFNLSCPHQNTALRWNDSDHEFQCPKHHSQYEPDGAFIRGRATRGMDRFAIQRAGTSVAIDLDQLYQQDTDAAAWAAAVVKLV